MAWACRVNDAARGPWSRRVSRRVRAHEPRRPVRRAPRDGLAGTQWPASTSTRVRSRHRASRPSSDRRRDEGVAERRRRSCTGTRGAPRQRAAAAAGHVGAVEVDRLDTALCGHLAAPRQQVDRSGRGAASAGRMTPAPGARLSSGSTGIRKHQTYQLCRSCGSIRSRPRQVAVQRAEVVERRPADRGVRSRSGPPVAGPRSRRRRRPSPRTEPQSWPTRCTCSPAGTVASRTRDQVLDQHREVGTTTGPRGRVEPPGAADVVGDDVPVLGAGPRPPAPTSAGRRGSRAPAPRAWPRRAVAVLPDAGG